MGRILIIAEKPSVGRDIAKVLGCSKRGQGCLVGEDYIVSWAVGHLVGLYEPEDYAPSLKKWSAATLPILPEEMKLKALPSTKDQLDVLSSLMNDTDTDSLVCATDSGREGELIFRYIYQLTGCVKPFQRLWISSMTDAAIKEGFQKLKNGEEYDRLYLSAKCRSEADWLVGMNATRAYTIQNNALLSIGRVQTPTLGIIIARQQEIDAFQIEEYYEVQGLFQGFNATWFKDQESNTKLPTEAAAKEIAEKIQGHEAAVTRLETEEKRQPAPLLYDLTELQRDCNKKYGYSAQKTLSIAQSLYETKKLITYPRTDSRYLSDDMKGKIQHTLTRLANVQGYQSYAQQVLTMNPLPLSKRIIDNSKVTDHHAIIPTDGNIRLEGLSQEEKQVFHLVVLRFLSVFFPPYITSLTKMELTVEGETLLAKGTTVLQPGWQELYSKLDIYRESETAKGKKTSKKEAKKEEQQLPNLSKGDILPLPEAKVLKKKTTPPKPYTEAGLLSAMENAGRFIEDEALKEQMKDSGLGTPATRAAIIERLLTVGYIERKGKALIPTEKGKKLIAIVPEQLKSPETTGKWEKGLSSIAKGSMDPARFMQSIKKYVTFLVTDSKKRKHNVTFAPERKGKPYTPKGKSYGECPLCGGKVYANSKSYFCANWQQGCKFTIWKDSLEKFGTELTEEMVEQLLQEKELKDVPLFHPGSQAPATAALVLNESAVGRLQIINLKKV